MAYFNHITAQLPNLNFDFDITTTHTFQYGPVLLKNIGAKDYLIPFEFMRIHVKKHPLSLTFINKNLDQSAY
jgi:hypothetical protein